MKKLFTMLAFGLLYTSAQAQDKKQLTFADIIERVDNEARSARAMFKEDPVGFAKKYAKQIKETNSGGIASPYEIAKLYVIDQATRLGRWKEIE